MAFVVAAPVVVLPLFVVVAPVEISMLAVGVVLPLAVGRLVVDDRAAAAGNRSGGYDSGKKDGCGDAMGEAHCGALSKGRIAAASPQPQ